ncbi:transcriptional regulator [Niallia circulans]|uniref:GTP cyclohydrolase 1 type 2 homolog n=1 Tax=Niallia circulans TaxID=1397 RepID=A0A268F908_NIACI|nr:Nif3-like dinuclear metal center hexameric protein [Niallia circulans]AYV67451.1 transcriptional regulator [Niallia circulans]PAD81814.1 transcriptional regulator [Niallia circulans]QJX63399.1 transcriptional regulator [Niallia circulans]
MTTIQEVIDKLMEPAKMVDSTTDVLIKGSADTEVKRIVIAFTVTQQVLEKAISIGANMIISHEGPFYSHENRKELYEKDPVYMTKLQLIEDAAINIFRFHDYYHRYNPDGVMVGLIQKLEWENYIEKHQSIATTIVTPKKTVADIATYVKVKLDAPFVRVVGELSMECQRIGLLAGYRGGGEVVIPLFQNQNLDLIIAGEGPEWESPEYVRDAVQQGRKKALILIGHAVSEEPGMEYLTTILANDFPHIPVHYIKEKPLFQII